MRESPLFCPPVEHDGVRYYSHRSVAAGSPLVSVLQGLGMFSLSLGIVGSNPAFFAGAALMGPYLLGRWKDRNLKGLGWIRARSLDNSRILWDRQIFWIDYDLDLESDVQDCFITRLEPLDGCLKIETEAGEFLLDLTTQRLTPPPLEPYSRIIPVLSPR